MKTVYGLLFLLFVASPANAIAKALTCSMLWSWFASEYGAGPSLGAWFGFALIFGVGMNVALRNVPTEKTPPDKIIQTAAARTAGVWFGCVCLLASARAIGAVFGWI